MWFILKTVNGKDVAVPKRGGCAKTSWKPSAFTRRRCDYCGKEVTSLDTFNPSMKHDPVDYFTFCDPCALAKNSPYDKLVKGELQLHLCYKCGRWSPADIRVVHNGIERAFCVDCKPAEPSKAVTGFGECHACLKAVPEKLLGMTEVGLPICSECSTANKKCAQCEDLLPLDFFGIDKSTSDGLHRVCRVCRGTYRRQKSENEKAKDRERKRLEREKKQQTRKG